MTFIFYGIALISLIVSFTPLLFKTVSGFLTREIALLINTFSSLIYIVLYYISINFFDIIYKSMGKEGGSNVSSVARVFGIPFYFTTYFYFKKKIKEDMGSLQ